MNARRFFLATPAPRVARPTVDAGPVSMRAEQWGKGFRIPPPPASAVRLAGSTLVLAGTTSVLDTAPRKAHNAAECDYCLTGERHPAQMF